MGGRLDALDRAELYWITTVRPDGRPHVTPLIGVVSDDVVLFLHRARGAEGAQPPAERPGCHHDREQHVGEGLDVVVEGKAVRVDDDEQLRPLAAAWVEKYGDEWHFDVYDGMFRHSDGGGAAVFRVEPAKVLAFAKDPHGQTTYRF